MIRKQNHRKDVEAPCVISFLCAASAAKEVQCI